MLLVSTAHRSFVSAGGVGDPFVPDDIDLADLMFAEIVAACLRDGSDNKVKKSSPRLPNAHVVDRAFTLVRRGDLLHPSNPLNVSGAFFRFLNFRVVVREESDSWIDSNDAFLPDSLNGADFKYMGPLSLVKTQMHHRYWSNWDEACRRLVEEDRWNSLRKILGGCQLDVGLDVVEILICDHWELVRTHDSLSNLDLPPSLWAFSHEIIRWRANFCQAVIEKIIDENICDTSVKSYQGRVYLAHLPAEQSVIQYMVDNTCIGYHAQSIMQMYAVPTFDTYSNVTGYIGGNVWGVTVQKVLNTRISRLLV